MFGYLKPTGYGSAKQIRQYYRRQYCTLCHALWQHYGFRSRFILSYDMAFLACLFDLDSTSTNMSDKDLCYKQQSVLSEEWKKLASLSLFMVEGKLIDDVYDSNSPVAKIVMRLLKKSFDRAAADYRQTHDIVLEGFDNFRQLEKQTVDVMCLANAFADIMESSAQSLFQYQESTASIIHHVARWVYLIDAIDDLEDDLKEKRFNPYTGMASTKEELVTKHKTQLMDFAQVTTQQVKSSLQNWDATKLSSMLIGSVLNITIPNTSAQILANRKLRRKKIYVRLIEGRNVVYE